MRGSLHGGDPCALNRPSHPAAVPGTEPAGPSSHSTGPRTVILPVAHPDAGASPRSPERELPAPWGIARLLALTRAAASLVHHGLVGPAIEALLPADCPACARPLPGVNRHGICERCWASLQPVRSPLCPRCGIPFAAPFDGTIAMDRVCGRCHRHPPAFDGARCALVFEGAVRTILHLFKFEQRPDFAKPLAAAIADSLPPEERFDLVVPVPLHWTRRLKRGYNQAALLGRRIARAADAPL